MTATPAPSATPHDRDWIFEQVEKHHVRFIDLQFTDIVGMVKSVTVPVQQLPRVLEEGVWFDGSSIEGFARISESDMFLVPVPETFAIIPWNSGSAEDAPYGHHTTARLICNVHTPDGEPFMGAPRAALMRMMDEAHDLGYEFRTGPEIEFFLFGRDEWNEPDVALRHDEAGYFDATADRAVLVRQDMITALEAFGIEVEAGHHEAAPSQHEIDFRYGNALRSADHSVTFKYVLKAIAQQHGLYATFMPKPLFGVAGSGMHIHQSLARLDTGENAFSDPDAPYGLSEVACQFIAGQLAHARGMCAVLAPLVNSYKRLVSGFEAPVYVSWARVNRSALIRVPRAVTDAAVRAELRCPDPSCNPYLAAAVMLAAGLDGIRNEMRIPDPTEEDLFESEWARRGLTTLPGSLEEAVDALEQDPVIQDALGPHIYERFVDAKRQEWQAFCVQVTEWERQRYLPIF
ncbi:MAG: type I glutamate--ammonia ligase [Anaerolineae bacterium]